MTSGPFVQRLWGQTSWLFPSRIFAQKPRPYRAVVRSTALFLGGARLRVLHRGSG